jgi:DNA-binding CsgD family transcriptional regulator
MSVNGRVESRAVHAVASNGQLIALLSPRLLQTLALLMSGASEKQVAARLHVSVHTIHCHGKALHQRFGVESRAELLATVVFEYLLEPEAVRWLTATMPKPSGWRPRRRGR